MITYAVNEVIPLALQLPYQEAKSGLEAVLLPPRSAVTPVKLNHPMKSSKLWSPTIENDRPTGMKVNAKYNTQLHESLEGSPRKRILSHANPDRSSQHVEGPVAALKLMFDNVVAAIKHAFSKEDSNTIHGQDPVGCSICIMYLCMIAVCLPASSQEK